MEHIKKKAWMLTIGAVMGLVLIGAVGAAAVYAQSPTPPTPGSGQAGPGQPGDAGSAHHGLSQAELVAASKALGMTSAELSTELANGKPLPDIAKAKGVDFKVVMDAIQVVRPMHLVADELDAAAQALGMTSTELSAQLDSGKTLADLATAKDVTLKTVQDAIQAARRAEMTTQIQQAVSSGQMTQAKADWLLEGLKNGYLDGPDGLGFGRGIGMGGLGPGNGQAPSQPAPTAAP